jgi:uroporphyrinogen-III decarboxylase
MKNSATEKLSEATSVPVRTKEDFTLFDWFYEMVKNADWSACVKDIRNTLAPIKDRVLASIFLVPPYELLYWTRRDEMFLLEFDYPREYKSAMDKIIDAYDTILSVAKEAGIQLVAYGAPGGTEFTSPTTWSEGIVPTSAKLQKLIVSHGLYSTYHCCGKINTLIPSGFFNDICPNILETLSPPPVGDVTDIKKARSMLSKKIITHGNMDLTFLRDSTVAEVKKLAFDIIEQTAGFPHIVGAADGCLWPGTPPENLKVVCELFN